MACWSGILGWIQVFVAYSSLHKFFVYARDNINLGNSESFCKIILLIFVIFELRHKSLLLFTKTKGTHQHVGL